MALWNRYSPDRKNVAFNSKHTTPELPVLEGAAAELSLLDEFGLLPAAAIDTAGFETPTTAIPASREEEEDSDQEDFAHALSRSLDWKGQLPRLGSYLPMWCRFFVVGEGNVFVVPWCEASGKTIPKEVERLQQIETVHKIWCRVESDGKGGRQLAACRDSSSGDPIPVDGSQWSPEGLKLENDELPTAPPPPTMLRLTNLPIGLTQEDLIEILDREEASGVYDFVFMPSFTASSSSSLPSPIAPLEQQHGLNKGSSSEINSNNNSNSNNNNANNTHSGHQFSSDWGWGRCQVQQNRDDRNQHNKGFASGWEDCNQQKKSCNQYNNNNIKHTACGSGSGSSTSTRSSSGEEDNGSNNNNAISGGGGSYVQHNTFDNWCSKHSTSNNNQEERHYSSQHYNAWSSNNNNNKPFSSTSSNDGEGQWAIVHCVSNEVAVELAERLLQRTFWCRGLPAQNCRIEWAETQSLEEMVEICRNFPQNFQPMPGVARAMLFHQGWPVELPPPLVEQTLSALLF